MSEKEYIKAIGAKVREARKARGYSLTSLAPLCELHYSSLSFLETGRTAANIITLYRIAKVLAMDVKDFL